MKMTNSIKIVAAAAVMAFSALGAGAQAFGTVSPYYGGNWQPFGNPFTDVYGNPVGQAFGQPLTGDRNSVYVQGFYDPYAGYGPNTAASVGNGQTKSQRSSSDTSASTKSSVVVSRVPYGRYQVQFRGDTSNVSQITLALLDKNRREVNQALVTSPPAEAVLTPYNHAVYYQVTLQYLNGSTRRFTGRLSR